MVAAHLTTYDTARHPIGHSRYTWPTDAVRISDYYAYWSQAAPDMAYPPVGQE